MPVEAKPLFRPDVLRPHLAAFELPAHVAEYRPTLDRWSELLTSSRANNLKEQELLPDFLTDFFVGLLAYRRPADGGDGYTFSREKHVQVDGKFADAVIGEFNGADKYVIALEGKGPKDPLERAYAGRKMSAVDQGYRYAINLPCDWIIVTSMRQTRLYFKGADQQTYERFDTELLAASEAHLNRFVFMLGADRVVPPAGKCHLYDLLAESEQVGRKLTNEFYKNYAEIRQQAFKQLCHDNAEIPRPEVLATTQKLLDRVLFCAFAEDRGLLPTESLKQAHEHRDPYHPRPVWDNFRELFDAVNQGNAALGIHAYNGGLFADDSLLNRLTVSDDVCRHFYELGEFDYRPPHLAGEGSGELIDVDILGHIFEQSITDLERIRNELEGIVEPKSRRKREGAFYTPPFITRYIVEQALGGVLRDRFETLRSSQQESKRGKAAAALEDPNVYELGKLTKPARAALVTFWELWQEELATIRLLDPACGSGAFLIEAFDQLHAANQASNDRLKELRGHPTLFDPDKRILEQNLYGVDLNDEAIEICRLSLWIKTAQRGKPLTSLDHTIRAGNSIVADATAHPRAFDWQEAFPEVFGAGGFDVVVGNPPYVRQELLSSIKPYLQSQYAAYHGMADLYVYFYELGLRMLKPGGLLSYIVTNKWMKSGYGEPLRRYFSEQAWIESVVDFGHAKQIFEDADVFPSIIVARRPTEAPKPKNARLCTIPREQLRIDDLSRQIEADGSDLPLSQLGTDAWQLEPYGVTSLMAKVRSTHASLAEFSRVKPYRGILTGLNDAFLIDTETRDRLIEADPGCERIIRPYRRGQDIGRWSSEWAGLWMIAIPSSNDRNWEWGNADEVQAERIFKSAFPSIHDWFKPLEARLRKRQDKGRFWWELRSCGYWSDFELPKIVYQEIQFHPRYAFDSDGHFGNNKTFFLPTNDLYLLAVLNSPLIWWFNWRTLPHMKDEALSPVAFLMETVPIAAPSEKTRATIESDVTRVVEIVVKNGLTRNMIGDWIRTEYEVEKVSRKLLSLFDLDSNEFVDNVRKARGKKNPISAAGLKNLRDEYARTIEPARGLAAEMLTLEHRLSDLVNEAYGLKPEEVDLMWKTAPPRMPIGASRDNAVGA